MEDGLRIDEKILGTVVYLGSAGTNPFVPFGTGFIVQTPIDEDRGWQAVVTAKHVIEKIPGVNIYIRLNNKRGEAEVLCTPKSFWIAHPDRRIDVSLCPTRISKDQFDFVHFLLNDSHILTDAATVSFNIGIGDEIFIAGMFVPRLGEKKNIPILRIGTIAAMTGEKIRTEYGYHDAYLLEVRSIDGLSGSPVCLYLPPARFIPGNHFISPAPKPMVLLMGMLLGYNEVVNPGDDISIITDLNREESGDPILTPLNTGIAVVLPIAAIIEALNQPIVREQVDLVLQATDAQRRFKTSAGEKQGTVE